MKRFATQEPPTKNKTSRISFTAPTVTKDALERLADDRGVSVAAIIKFLLERSLVIEAILEDGGKVIALAPDGRQLVLADSEVQAYRELALSAGSG